MAKYRLEFSKTGETKFVSHLDLVRLFSRAFHRAELPLAYSEGFNPHPKMSIGIPLSVGVTSECELFDVEFFAEVAPRELLERLNENLPRGIRIMQTAMLSERSAKLSSVVSADYRVSLVGAAVSSEQIADFMARETIEIEKKTKRSEKLTDIKPDIFSLSAESDSVLLMRLAAGSAANLKPDLVIAAMRLYLADFAPSDYEVHRVKLLDAAGYPLI